HARGRGDGPVPARRAAPATPARIRAAEPALPRAGRGDRDLPHRLPPARAGRPHAHGQLGRGPLPLPRPPRRRAGGAPAGPPAAARAARRPAGARAPGARDEGRRRARRAPARDAGATPPARRRERERMSCRTQWLLQDSLLAAAEAGPARTAVVADGASHHYD